MRKIIRKILAWIPYDMYLPLIFMLLWNFAVYNGSRLITTGLFHYNLETALDRQIPFLPWTVFIYFCFHVFCPVHAILACRQDKAEAYRFVSAEFLAKTFCLICFLLLPTTNTRPVVGSETIWDFVMKWLYKIDAADNLFPSIHCLESWFCFIAVRKNPAIPKWYRCFTLFLTIAICLSTLTTKQHVIVDTISGIFAAELCYQITGKIGFQRIYEAIFSRLSDQLKHDRCGRRRHTADSIQKPL